MENSLKDNSKKVAYLYKLDDPEYLELKGILEKGGWISTFIEVPTLKEVREIVEEKDYYAWDEMWIGAKNDTSKFPVPIEDDYGFDKAEVESLKSQGKTTDEIWEALKVHYEPVIGYAYSCVNSETKAGSVGEYEAIKEFKKAKKKAKDNELFESLRLSSGDIVSAYICESMRDRYPERFLFIYSGVEGEFITDYNREWKNDLSPDFREGIDLDPEGWRITWGCIDRSTARLATESEVNEFNDAIKKAGLVKVWKGDKLCLRLNV